jgi:hypothetical protein
VQKSKKNKPEAPEDADLPPPPPMDDDLLPPPPVAVPQKPKKPPPPVTPTGGKSGLPPPLPVDSGSSSDDSSDDEPLPPPPGSGAADLPPPVPAKVSKKPPTPPGDPVDLPPPPSGEADLPPPPGASSSSGAVDLPPAPGGAADLPPPVVADSPKPKKVEKKSTASLLKAKAKAPVPTIGVSAPRKADSTEVVSSPVRKNDSEPIRSVSMPVSMTGDAECVMCKKTAAKVGMLPVGEFFRHPTCMAFCAKCFQPVGMAQQAALVGGKVHHSHCAGIAGSGPASPLGFSTLRDRSPTVASPVVTVGGLTAQQRRGSTPVPVVPRRGSQPPPSPAAGGGAASASSKQEEGDTQCTICNKFGDEKDMMKLGKTVWKHKTCELVCYICRKTATGQQQLKIKHGKVLHVECKEGESGGRCGGCHQADATDNMTVVVAGVYKHDKCTLICPWCDKHLKSDDKCRMNAAKTALLHTKCRSEEKKASSMQRETREAARWGKYVGKAEPNKPKKVKMAPDGDERLYKEYMLQRMKREEWENAMLLKGKKLRQKHTARKERWLIDGGWSDDFPTHTHH